MTEQQFSAELDQWRTERLAFLHNPDGYLSLAGLCWLREGIQHIGSASNNDCIFPAGLPASIGTINVTASGIMLTITEGVQATHAGEPVRTLALLADADPNGPTIIEQGSVSWFVIRRGDALGIRIRDSRSQMLQTFTDVERFEDMLAWRISAEFQPHPEPKTVPIPTILGTPADMVSPGVVKFTHNGHTHTLTALQGSAGRLFLIIADATTGNTSYGGGRFLYTEPVDDACNVVVDFNKATNPPCAFSPYATCPRPPAENRLPFAVHAGEKTFHYDL